MQESFKVGNSTVDIFPFGTDKTSFSLFGRVVFESPLELQRLSVDKTTDFEQVLPVMCTSCVFCPTFDLCIVLAQPSCAVCGGPNVGSGLGL